MPLVATSVRWDSTTYEIIKAEAADASVTVAQFVREAAIARAMIRGARRGDQGFPADFERLALEVERLARVRSR